MRTRKTLTNSTCIYNNRFLPTKVLTIIELCKRKIVVEKITPEQSSLLDRPNFGQYPTEQELYADKGMNINTNKIGNTRSSNTQLSAQADSAADSTDKGTNNNQVTQEGSVRFRVFYVFYNCLYCDCLLIKMASIAKSTSPKLLAHPTETISYCKLKKDTSASRTSRASDSKC